MIDLEQERVLNLASACAWVAEIRGGDRPHVNTVLRWILDGLSGVRLESVRVGGHRVTSVEALIRFFEALTAAAGERGPTLGSIRRQESAARERRRLAEESLGGLLFPDDRPAA